MVFRFFCRVRVSSDSSRTRKKEKKTRKRTRYLTVETLGHVDVGAVAADGFDGDHQLDDVDEIEEAAPQRQRAARKLRCNVAHGR